MFEALELWVQAHTEGVLGFSIGLSAGWGLWMWGSLIGRWLRGRAKKRERHEEPKAAWWYKDPVSECFRKSRELQVEEAMRPRPESGATLPGLPPLPDLPQLPSFLLPLGIPALPFSRKIKS
jgi:hypothetical protein